MDIEELISVALCSQAFQAVFDQHTRDLARASQLAANQAEVKLKVKLDEDQANITSLEVKLAYFSEVNKVTKESAQSAKTKLGKSESTWQKIAETLVETEHILFEVYSQFEDTEKIWKEESYRTPLCTSTSHLPCLETSSILMHHLQWTELSPPPWRWSRRTTQM